MAVFHILQNYPSLSDKLTILVMIGMTTGSIFFNMEVGIWSNSQDLLLRDWITLHTGLSVSVANLVRWGDSLSFGVYFGLSLNKSWIFWNFFSKKVANFSDSWLSDVHSGQFASTGLVVRYFNKCVKFPQIPLVFNFEFDCLFDWLLFSSFS